MFKKSGLRITYPSYELRLPMSTMMTGWEAYGTLGTLRLEILQVERMCFPSLFGIYGSTGSTRSMGSAPGVPQSAGPVILELPLDKIRRPLMRTRSNDQKKVKELMDSIKEIGLQVPIDVLEVDGVYYGTIFDKILLNRAKQEMHDNGSSSNIDDMYLM
ncbi:Sulfiredoxin, chloroplastic/mitochondrial [Capsicum annuum]|nr:Sulfiredoxin, chloroplastic/mitochondrial [Capsicum annuum]